METITTLWNDTVLFLQSAPLDQLIALGIFTILFLTFTLQASATYRLTINGVEKTIVKVRAWPGHTFRTIWLAIALSFPDQLWIATIVAISTVMITIFVPQVLNWITNIARPEITQKEIDNLKNSF